MMYYFKVLNLELSCTNNQKKTIISDSIQFHKAHFSFDSAWDGYSITVFFTNTKTNVSKLSVLDINNDCDIPWEVLQVANGDNYLEVGAFGVNGDSKMYTTMQNLLPIEKSSKTDSTIPTPPTQGVYDQIMTEFANRYVDAIYTTKTILTTDWLTATDIVNITPTFTPIVINSDTYTMRTGNFGDYLDRTSYTYGDFYLDYSIDGLTTTRISATSESGSSPSLRKIIFTINSNTYEVRITSTTISIRRKSGTTAYYIHSLLLRFDDYFYYDYTVSGLTPYYKSNIFIEDNSKEYLREISFNRFPTISGNAIRLNFSQKPIGTIYTKFFGFKTDENIGQTEIVNLYGNAVFENVSDMPIDDLDTTHDNDLATIGQIKDYINSKLV